MPLGVVLETNLPDVEQPRTRAAIRPVGDGERFPVGVNPPAGSTQTGEPRVIERRVLVPVQPPTDHSGAWMHDPNYRSALERTTVAGHPENAKARDPNKTTPTPFGR